MTDWLKIDKAAIFTGKDENGNRYLSQFLKDYQDTFHPDMINAGCLRCLEDYYKTFIKHLSTMSKKESTGYQLKEKYNGIPLEFGSPVYVSNANLTDELAEKLLKRHPAGKDLFKVIPEPREPAEPKAKKSTEPTEPKVKKLTDHTRKELDAMAEKLGIDPKNYSKKDEVAAAIEDVESATAQSKTEEGSENPE